MSPTTAPDPPLCLLGLLPGGEGVAFVVGADNLLPCSRCGHPTAIGVFRMKDDRTGNEVLCAECHQSPRRKS